MRARVDRASIARVSIHDQDSALQLDALRQAGCGRVFKDRGVSGAQADRPGLGQALVHLREGEGDVLVVWKLDRLGRSMAHLIDTVIELEELADRPDPVERHRRSAGLEHRDEIRAVEAEAAGELALAHAQLLAAQPNRSARRQT
jgi:hypothetical protein